jgi:hypothetical protein
MLVGQTLLAPSAVGQTYNGPWLSRQSDQATFLLEILRISSANCSVTVTVQHKMKEEIDTSAATLVAFAAVAAVGVYTKSTAAGSGMKELVRYTYLVKYLGAVPEWVHLRMDDPVWQPN